MPEPHYGLIHQVHRSLAKRILAGVVVIASAFGATAFLSHYDEIGQDAVIHAVNGIERLRLEVRTQMRDPGTTLAAAIHLALDAETGQGPVSRYGHFVFARFYTPDGTVLASRTEHGLRYATELDDYLQQTPLQFPDTGDPVRDPVRIAGHPHIEVAVAIADRNGRLAAYGAGLFALSDAAVSGTRNAAFAAAAQVVAVVLATALLLYPLILALTRRIAAQSERLLAANLQTVQVLGSAIAKRDSDTDAHNYRVTLYAARLAESAGLDKAGMQGLIKGAFLHDVGKIGIRDHILHKPGKLDDDEFRTMKTHVDQGLEIVGRSAWLADATGVVGGHHEKFDGSGYPNRLHGDRIPLAARIFAIVDVFDALTSRRPYKAPFPLAETLQILAQGRGTHFDPGLLDRFAELAEELHNRYGGRDDDGLRDDLDRLVQRYFTA